MLELLNLPLIFAPLLLMPIGLVLLIYGGNWTIDAAIYIARKYGMSPLLVGFTIIAFGTSFPELMVSLLANMDGSGGIALGNVIGSNIANILLIMGVTATLVPFALTGGLRSMRNDFLMMLGSALILIGVLLDGEISRVEGIGMLMLLCGYLGFQYVMVSKGAASSSFEAEEVPAFSSLKKAFLFLFLGLCVIAIGAKILVEGAEGTAQLLGVPDAIIALSIIAFGTSLPELSTCLIALRKGHGDMAIGNVLGSNVLNIMLIVGLTTLIKPIAQGSFAPQLVSFDIWVMLGVSVAFMGLIVLRKQVSRLTGVLFCLAYAAYTVYIYMVS